MTLKEHITFRQKKVLFESQKINKMLIQKNRCDMHSHQSELSAAIELREIGKYKEAQEWLSNFIEHDSRNTEALSLLSQVLLLDKKEAEAEKALTAAASINPELPSVYRNQARLLLKQSKTAEALEKAQLGCRKSPEEPESLLVLAACLGANQRDLEALPLIEKILKANSNYAEAYASRALIRLRAKKTTGAIEDAEMAISLKPHLTQMWQLLSSLHYQANNLSDAIAVLRSAHKNEPENPDFMVQLGEFLRQDNKASEAITILYQATKLAPKNAKAWTNLGVAFQQEKRIADAKIAYEKALALNPKLAAIAVNLGTMAKEAGEWESALQYFGKALEIETDFAEAHYNLGATLNELGRLEEAEASYRQAIALKPDFAEAHCNLGITLNELGRLEEAEASLKQAVALKPDKFAAAYDRLGAILQKKGKIDEAEVCFRKWSSLEPRRTPKTLSKGTIFFKQGSFEQALEAFENYDDAMSKAQILEALYALGRVGDIYSRLDAEAGLNDDNLRVAAIAAFLAEREKKDTAHNFCNKPMEFLHFANISSYIVDHDFFIASVIDELQHVQTKWELNTTRNGFQASVDVFKNPLEKLSRLKQIILDEIDVYYSKFKNETCSYITKWPTEKNIQGWHVVLNTQGHQTAHIHPSGWLSGVIYLKVVPALGENEGAIEFSLNGPNYHHKNSPSTIFQPEVGDIVFFPSSLYHRTIPFTTDTDRIIVSFDLQPGAATH